MLGGARVVLTGNAGEATRSTEPKLAPSGASVPHTAPDRPVNPPGARSRRRWAVVRCFLSAASVASALAGCVAVGPSFKTPAGPTGGIYTRTALPATTAAASGALGRAQRFVAAPHVAPEWWRAFGSRELDAWVDRALRTNPTLVAAAATLREAREIYLARAGSTLYPTVGANFGTTREEITGAMFGQPQIPQETFTLATASAAVNYDFDLFGGNRRALEALAAQTHYARFELVGARLMLAADVVTAAFGQAQFAAQIDAVRAILASQRRELDIAREGVAIGTASSADVLALRTEVEQTRATLPPLRNELEQADHLLAVLVGRAPSAADVPRFSLRDFILPARLPVVVPSELVRQRPDVQAATALLHAATAQYDVAVSALFPKIDLSASLGSAALSAGALFGPASMIWSLAGALAQPLFNAGLKPAADAAEENLQAVGASYRQTVLRALQGVADALRQCQNDAQALTRQSAAYASALRSLALVQGQYRVGAASYLQWLDADRQLQQIRIALVAARAARLADSAALYQAMGGGALVRRH